MDADNEALEFDSPFDGNGQHGPTGVSNEPDLATQGDIVSTGLSFHIN